MDWTYKITRWVLSAIFIYAGGTKLLEPETENQRSRATLDV
jgi:hypothetical protein